MIVFHLHIPRTGGTAVMHSVQNGFGKDRFIKYRSISQVEKDLRSKQEPVAVGGHFYWGLHEICKMDHLYFVVLRDPVERVSSLYDYVVAREGHKYHPLWSRTSLHQVLAENLSPLELSNWQTRQICGEPRKREPVSGAMLEKAWEHLSQPNVIVTFTDMLNDGLLQLGAQTGIYFRHLRRKHNASRRSFQSEEAIDLIRKANALDIDLYSRARSEFLNRLENPARLPDVNPLQVYRERVAAHRLKEEMLDNLPLHRAEMSQHRSDLKQVQSRLYEEQKKKSNDTLKRFKRLFPLKFRKALKNLVSPAT